MIEVSNYDRVEIEYPYDGSSSYLDSEYFFEGLQGFINHNEYRFIKNCTHYGGFKHTLEFTLRRSDFDFFMAWVRYCNTLDIKYLQPYLPTPQKVTLRDKAIIMLEELDKHIQINWNMKDIYIKAIESGLQKIESLRVNKVPVDVNASQDTCDYRANRI